jgi:hypothetical protein
MAANNRRLIFELTAREKESRLKPALVEAVRKAADLNLPIIYRNELCTEPGLFIHKYPNGKEVLVKQDTNNFTEKTVKVLH